MADHGGKSKDGFIHAPSAFKLDLEGLMADKRGGETFTMEEFAYEAGILALRVRASKLCPGCASNVEMQVGMAILQYDSLRLQKAAAEQAINSNHPGSETKQ